jgi:hypothetical protein
MRTARALGSLPRLRWQLVPTARSRSSRGRREGYVNAALEKPAQDVSSVSLKRGLADKTPLISSLTLLVIRPLVASLVVVALIPNLILGAIFCAGHLFAELRGSLLRGFLGRRLLSVIRVSDRRRRMRTAQALSSLPHLRRQLVPPARSRPSRGRLQWKFNTAVPAQGVSSVNVKPTLADQTPLVSSLTLSVIRALIASLVLVAVIPNLMLAAIFWLGVVDTPWSRLPTHANDKTISAQSAVPTPVLSSPAMLEASAGGDITFPIALDGTDGVPVRSIIAIRGLPQGSKLSSGRPYDETEWNLKPDEIGDLHLVLPSNVSGEAKLLMQLVAPDGAIIADAATVLKMPADSTAKIGTSDPKTDPIQTQVSDEGAQAGEENDSDGSLAKLDAASATPGDPIPLPLRRPTQTSREDANWITLTSVNLRKRPTRSAPTIGVVAKGAKLHLIGRKRSWVQVTNPATSEEGWIYARHVASVRRLSGRDG